MSRRLTFDYGKNYSLVEEIEQAVFGASETLSLLNTSSLYCVILDLHIHAFVYLNNIYINPSANKQFFLYKFF